MLRFLLRRLLLFPVILLAANFLAYAYGFYIGPVQAVRNPYAFGRIELPPFLPGYLHYLQGAIHLDFGLAPNQEPIGALIARTSLASLALIFLALFLSVIVGLLLGLGAVRLDPPRTAPWLTILTTAGLASPSFFIGILFISISVLFFLYGPTTKPLLPFQGFGWDSHLVLPTLALMVRPTVQIAQVSAGLMVGEMESQYVVAARSFGHSIQRIRSHFAFRSILAPVILTIAGGLRMLVAELIIVERLFNWPGVGRLISTTLVITNPTDLFLNPPLLGTLLTALVAFFLLADLAASTATRIADPRLRTR